jgi:predicted ATPase
VAALAAGIEPDGAEGTTRPPGGVPFAGGVWWVELAPLAAGADVAPAVAAALGVSAPAGHALPGAIADAVGSRRTLLVLDNCEHVLESCAALADALLRACPGLTVLATSRVALGGDGETVWPLPPLAHPARTPGAPSGAFGGGGGPAAAPVPAGEAELAALAEYGSVQLFVARARAASPRFALTAQNAAAVRAVCARLDGLPLALELAAAAVGVLGVEQVAARLDDAFAVLTRGRRTALPRHRTLGALLDWSYDLLGPAERRLLARLSVFRAAVPIEAVEAVGGDDADDADVLGAFAGLVDHSLVDVGERDGEPHYRLLETVRQYAAERLRAAPADEAATRRRHARWMAARADVMGEETGGPRRGRAMAGFHPLVEDARAALEWSTGPDGDRVDALRVAGGLAIFWHWAGLWAEGRRWAEAAVRAADTAAAQRGEGDDVGRPLAERVALAKALQTALLLAWMLGEPEATLAHAARALPLWATAEADPGADRATRASAAQWAAYAHEILAFARFALGDVAGAEASVEAAVAAADRSGSGWARGLALGWRAMLATPAGRPADAARDLARAEAELAAVGDTWVLSWCYANGAAAAIAQGDPVGAARLARAGVAALRSEPDWHYVSRALDALAEAGAAWLASPAAAAHPPAARAEAARAVAEVLGAAAGVRERSGTAVWPFDRDAHARTVEAARAALAPPTTTARGTRDARSRPKSCSRWRRGRPWCRPTPTRGRVGVTRCAGRAGGGGGRRHGHAPHPRARPALGVARRCRGTARGVALRQSARAPALPRPPRRAEPRADRPRALARCQRRAGPQRLPRDAACAARAIGGRDWVVVRRGRVRAAARCPGARLGGPGARRGRGHAA